MFRSMLRRPILRSSNMRLQHHSRPSVTITLAHRRMMAEPTRQRTMDDLPGNFDLATQSDLTRAFTDSVNFFGEKYSIAKQHGVSSPMMKMNLRGIPSVALLSHDTVKQWHQLELTGRARRGCAPAFRKLLGRPFSEMAGPDHSEWRKKAAPCFKPSTVGKLAPFIQHSVHHLLLNRIREMTANGNFVQFCPMAKRFAFEIGSKFVFGALLNDDERQYTFEMFQRFANAVTPKAMAQGMHDPDNPNTEWADGLRAKDELNQFLGTKHLEAQRLTATDSWDSTYGEDADCLLRSMLENDAEFIKPDYTLYDRVDSLLFIAFAAYDTSATSMTNMIYSMWQNPLEKMKVREAILDHPQLSDPDTIFDFDMLKSCNELECFINESQRMHAFLSTLIPRIVQDENGVEIGGYHLPKGTGLIIPLQFLHKGEGSWTDPLEFRPSRFDKSNGQKKADRGSIGAYNHIPFATGLHKCLGIHLAMMEMRMYATMLLRDWEFEIDESKLTEEGTVNHMNVTQSFPHFNVYLRLKERRQ